MILTLQTLQAQYLHHKYTPHYGNTGWYVSQLIKHETGTLQSHILDRTKVKYSNDWNDDSTDTTTHIIQVNSVALLIHYFCT